MDSQQQNDPSTPSYLTVFNKGETVFFLIDGLYFWGILVPGVGDSLRSLTYRVHP